MKFIVKEKDYEYEYMLAPGVFIIGRHDSCDLTLDSHAVSKQHLNCNVTPNGVYIRDLGSKNGTRVNDKTIREAEINDGDRIKIGDVTLQYKEVAGKGAATPSVQESSEELQFVEEEEEEEEKTPPEGSLVRVDPLQNQHEGLYERDGHWYVSDPATGREVEIVPTEKRQQAQTQKSLLATRKGRLIIGGAAAFILLLLALSLVTPDQEDPPEPPAQSFNLQESVGKTLEAIEAGELDRAEKMAQTILNANPQSGTAESLVQLVDMWKKHEDDFREYWLDLKRQLDDLEYNHESPEVRRFVRTHKTRLDESVLEYQRVISAQEAYEEGSYEEAYNELVDIGENRPARSDHPDLFEDIKSSWREQLEEQLQTAVARERWQQAQTIASELMDHFPDSKDNLTEESERYATLAHEKSILDEAEDAIGAGNHEHAAQILEQIPETSPHHEQASNMIAEAENLQTVDRAETLFNQGAATAALEILDGHTSRRANSLRRRIRSVYENYNAATESEAEKDYITAQQKWEAVMAQERNHQATSRFQRLAQNALRNLPDKRLEYAQELKQKAENHLGAREYEEARENFDLAVRMIPEGQSEPAEFDRFRNRLQSRGEYEYQNALNQDDPADKLERLNNALMLLPPDDYHHQKAQREKQKLEDNFD